MAKRWCTRAMVIPAALLALVSAGCARAEVTGDASPSPANAPASATVPTPAPALVTTPTTSTVPDGPATPERLTVQVLAETGHDPSVFTQGLEMADGVLYESSGHYGESFVRAVDRSTGRVLADRAFPDEVFAEGLTLSDGRLIVLSFRERTAFVLDPTTLAQIGAFTYEGEGWGVCDLGDRLVMSNGGDTLQFRDRASFAPIGELPVRLQGAPLDQLNELECVNGVVYANVWKSDLIVRIDLDSGDVTATIDASSLRPESTRADADAVLNGIAYDGATDSFLLRGKRWPKLYQVRFVS